MRNFVAIRRVGLSFEAENAPELFGAPDPASGG